jgi:hypothetical protein
LAEVGATTTRSWCQDDERLLFDDPSAIAGYGSFGNQNPAQDDSETQREMESLQRVVAKTADNMVDIFETAPDQDTMTAPHVQPPTQFVYPGQGVRVVRYQHLYQHLAARISAGDDVNAAANLTAPGSTAAVDWIATDEDDEYDYDVIEMTGPETQPHVLKLPDKPLVGTFADAAAAMGGRDG